jgi:putative membrane protein
MRAARDHLANERVFLAYIRTASALANFAVAILQLYRLQHNPVPRAKLTDYDLGIPLATVTLVLAIAVTVAGVWRFFACQNAMALREQIVTSGTVVLVFIPVSILVSLLNILKLSSLLNTTSVAPHVLHFHSYCQP